jgi:hypothetical protein
MTAKTLPQPAAATEASAPVRTAAKGVPLGRRRVLAIGIGAGLLTLLAAVLRFWRLGAIPPGFHYDEALEALEAWRVLTVAGYHPIYFPGDFGLAPTFVYLSSLAFHFFAPAPALSRSIAAAIGTLTVPALFALAWELTALDASLPVAMPLLAAAVLAVLRWHITFSRVAIEPILVPLYLVLVLWALLRGLRTNGVLTWLALGLALGLSLYSYPAAWLLPPLVAAIVVYLVFTARPRLAGHWRGLAAAALLAALIALPLVLELAGHPGRVLQRAGQVAVAGSSGAEQGVLAAIGSNTLKTLGMFSFTGDGDPRSNLPGVPAIDPLLSIPFYLGAVLVIWRWKRPAYGILLLAAAFMLASTVFSQYAPHFRRAVGVTPVIALLCAIGLGLILEPERSELGRRIQSAWARRRAAHASPATEPQSAGLARPIRLMVVVGLLLGATLLSIRTYFVVWGQSADLYTAYDEGLWQIGNYVKGLPQDQSLLITPRPAGDATLAFAWREGPTVRHFDGRHALVIPGDGRPATYIVIDHEDFRATRLLHELYPAAPVTKTFMDRAGQIYAQAITVPAGMASVRRPRTTVDYSWPGIHLMGYDLDKTAYHPGDVVYLQFWWQATAPLSDTWTVFTHVLGPVRPDGSTVWAGKDAQPGQGTVPTTTWQPGDTILDEYQIQLGQDLPPGDYPLEIGLYNLAGGASRAPTVNPAGQDHVILGTLHVE